MYNHDKESHVALVMHQTKRPFQHTPDKLADTVFCTKGQNIENKYLQFYFCNSSGLDIFYILEFLQSHHIFSVSFALDVWKWIWTSKEALDRRHMFHVESRRYEIVRYDLDSISYWA